MSRAPLQIQIHSRFRPLPLRTVIRRALVTAASHEQVGGGSSVAVLVCGDDEIREYNRRFAGEDHTTDVLSFPASVAPGATEPELGDIILSLDRVRDQAASAGHSLEREAATLVVHGFLHLLGYDHGNVADKRNMFSRTDAILAEAGLR
jgi:probable rRNA maturation factor